MNEQLKQSAKDEAAREYRFNDWNDFQRCLSGALRHAHDCEEAIINRAMEIYAEKRWIKTSDRLPNKGEMVLCNTVYGIQIGWLNVNGDWKFTNGGMQFSVEHWMPSPELPNNNNTEPKTTKQ